MCVGGGGEAQGYLWEDFSWQLGFPPHPKRRPGQGTCTDAVEDRLPGLPSDPPSPAPGDPGLQMPLHSRFPILTFQEGSGVSLVLTLAL